MSIHSEADKPPISFVVIKVAAKSPCLVLRIAFLGGTSGSHRLEVSQCVRVTDSRSVSDVEVHQAAHIAALSEMGGGGLSDFSF